MVIDIGSNTVKYDIFSLKKEKIKENAHRSSAIKLIGYIKDGRLSDEGCNQLCQTLNTFLKDAEEKKCDSILAFATASLRRLEDPLPILTLIKERTGLSVKLLSGEEESMCSFLGMLLSCPDLPVKGMMLDMGGGSTEINIFNQKQSIFRYSCPFGALSLKNTLKVGCTADKHTAQKIFEAADELLPDELASYEEEGRCAVIVGGTAKACIKLTEILFPEETVKNHCISRTLFEKLRSFFENASQSEIDKISKLIPERYDLMAAGLNGFEAIFKRMKTEKIIVSRGGIRQGYLSFIAAHGNSVQKTNLL